MQIGDYKFELKNFKYLEELSEETTCFSAMLYVNEQKLAECKNEGHGGSTCVDILKNREEFGKEVEDFLKTQPKKKIPEYGIELDINLEYIVDKLVDDCILAKELQKIEKKAKNHLVFKSLKGDYYTIGWKKQTLTSMLLVGKGREILKEAITEELSKGSVLVNKNLPAEVLPDDKVVNNRRITRKRVK